jgi:hypothetical protein
VRNPSLVLFVRTVRKDRMTKQVFGALVPVVLLGAWCARISAQAAPAAQGQSVVASVPAAQPPATPTPGPSRASAAPADTLILREGTDVRLNFANDLSSKTAAEGDPVDLVLAEDLKVGDVVVAKSGCKAVGEITNAKKAGMMGKAGELNLRLEHLKVGDRRVRLRGSKGKEGEGKVGTAVALTVLFGPIGLIKHGKNVEVKAGTALMAYVDEDASLVPLQ